MNTSTTITPNESNPQEYNLQPLEFVTSNNKEIPYPINNDNFHEENNHSIITRSVTTTTSTTTRSHQSSLHLLDDPSRFPDGWNNRAMITLFGSFLGMIGSLGYVNSGGVIQSYISENILINDSQSSIGWIFSIYNFFAFGGILISGIIFDKFGCRIPIFSGIIIMFSGLLATSFCHSLYQFILAYSILAGLGTAFVFGPFVACLSHYFLQKRALVIGISYTGGGLGGVIYPLMCRSLFSKIGYGWTMRIGAFISLFCCGIGWLLVSDRHKEFSPKSEKRQEASSSSIVDVVENEFISIIKEIFYSIDFKILYKNLLFTVLVFGLLFNGIVFLISIVQLPSYAISHGFSEQQSYLLLVVFNSFSIPGRIIPSYFADQGLGRFNTFCLINCFSLIAFVVIWLPFGNHLTALFIFAGCFGFSSGSVLSLTASLVASIVKTSDVGKGLGTAFFILSIADLFGIPIAGAIASGSKQSYNNLVYFLTACAAIGAIVSFISRYLYGGFNFNRV
ncbi:riboflavin transporter, putative [Candida dubliniensis CD36]|uniref:Riboflavin transporter, putative n=1 Tax=Candida dubliniensis (strain CD36 / ATCC MYA-646 / CBS 7987 / NCPF 3949 / NRRL Y-17841) TaxID=573826 RepID=B9WFV0_CANDC|nr:riboflavin transporter, putative [Candida dubliniensis CD36]CAX42119.1 riboflavin transporter, putative [Candida dubliniensis CD36]